MAGVCPLRIFSRYRLRARVCLKEKSIQTKEGAEPCLCPLEDGAKEEAGLDPSADHPVPTTSVFQPREAQDPEMEKNFLPLEKARDIPPSPGGVSNLPLPSTPWTQTGLGFWNQSTTYHLLPDLVSIHQ